jgi:general secretion pathway protein M
MSLLQRRALVSVTVTLMLVLVLALLAGQYVLRQHWQAAETLAQVEPRYARLLGLRDTGGRLEEALKQARAALSRLGYPAERDAAQVGNDLQQVARRALQAAGVSVTSSQVLSPRGETGFERISAAIQGEGALSRVQIALAALHTEAPAITVDSLVLQAAGRAAEDGTPIVSIRLTVSVTRLNA